VRGITKAVRPRLRSLAPTLLLVAIALLFGGCGAFGSDQNTFAPEGDVAEKQLDLFYLALWPAVVILILVFGAIVYALVRFRRRDEREAPPKQIHGNQRLELAWTILPAALLLGLAVPIVAGIIDLGREPSKDALQVTVHAFRWSWQFEYPDIKGADGKPLKTEVGEQIPELHIPIDREIAIHLQSGDVIHSFWVPKLAGKLDVMPGRNNRMWFNATKAGIFSAQCAEFCGLDHAIMRFRVVAQTPEDFDAWVSAQIASPRAAERNSSGVRPWQEQPSNGGR